MSNAGKINNGGIGRIGRGFTLVELLVVISIIGLLSTIAIVSTSTARDKARIAGAQSFEAQLTRAIGSSLAAEYDFEEGSGTSTADASGNGNGGALVNTPTWSTDTPFPASKYSLSFSGTNWVQTAKGFGVADSNFTVSAWVKTSSVTGQMYFVNNTGDGNGFRFGLSGGYMQFLIGNGANTESGCGGSQKVSDGKWHQMAISFSRTGLSVACYLDGRNVGNVVLASNYPGMRDGSTNIGLTACCTAFIGLIDSVKIFAQDASGVSFNPAGVAEKLRETAYADERRSVLY